MEPSVDIFGLDGDYAAIVAGSLDFGWRIASNDREGIETWLVVRFLCVAPQARKKQILLRLGLKANLNAYVALTWRQLSML